MGKETDLWDDSALINAFDQALNKYKAMHVEKFDATTTRGEISANNESEPSSTEQIHVHVESNFAKTSLSEVEAEAEAETEAEAVLSLPCGNNETAEEASTVQESQPEAGPRFPESTSAEDCTQLLTQYYELEEKRQRVIQQLQQAGYWNHPTSTQTPEAPQRPENSYPGPLFPYQCGAGFYPSDCSSFYPYNACGPSSQMPAMPTGAYHSSCFSFLVKCLISRIISFIMNTPASTQAGKYFFISLAILLIFTL
ncbi:unnamed protein product [Spirodela intermedia]|uniref:Survival Motor Neuron Gemin2-binding domain-containing protein n=1 Tax=Spirodela intermedia TaxID=51605 RepID=A0A7I8K867_SPIIN|nr:unnamed protein product [Spirodela intermedia]